jgi:hypothetical protein
MEGADDAAHEAQDVGTSGREAGLSAEQVAALQWAQPEEALQ